MGAVIRTTPKHLAALLKKRNEATLGAIARGALRGAQRGRAIVVKETPVDQGEVKAGWKVRPGDPNVLRGKRTLRAKIFGIKLASLDNSAPHAGIVELGARPHGVSEEGMVALTDWVLRHIAIGAVAGPVRKGGGGRRKFSREQRERIAREIAGRIALKIRKYGQEPTYFVKGCLPLLHGLTEAEVERAIERVASSRAAKGGS